MSYEGLALICKTRQEDGITLVLAPSVGHWVERPAMGALVRAGDRIGVLSILGKRRPLLVPDGVFGEVVGGLATNPARELDVSYGDVLLRIDPEAAGREAQALSSAASSSDSALAVRSPSSGRFWRRPSPDQPSFVSDGMEIENGHVIGLLEVMKTFTRLSYGGPGLPERARILRVVPEDGADVDVDAVLLELEEL